MGLHDPDLWAAIPRPERAALVAIHKLPDWQAALEEAQRKKENGR